MERFDRLDDVGLHCVISPGEGIFALWEIGVDDLDTVDAGWADTIYDREMGEIARSILGGI